jgi:hypothetical protein
MLAHDLLTPEVEVRADFLDAGLAALSAIETQSELGIGTSSI